MTQPESARYRGRPIGSVASLARALGMEESRLMSVSACPETFYRGPITVSRAGRKPRETYSPHGPLLDVQRRILDRILRNVDYPPYLMGGLPARSYVQNARRHEGAAVVFGQDVESFFPSISTQRVESIFKYVFHFAPEVAALLAKLCCRNGALVQGAPTSTHLSNLALYREEPQLEALAREAGFTYTRFVDDIHLSSATRVGRRSLATIVGELRSALERQGHRPKRAKQFVATQRCAIKVHGLNVNSSASVSLARRRALRSEVSRLERLAEGAAWDAALESSYLRLCTCIGQLNQTNVGEARRLKVRLDAIGTKRCPGVVTSVPPYEA